MMGWFHRASRRAVVRRRCAVQREIREAARRIGASRITNDVDHHRRGVGAGTAVAIARTRGYENEDCRYQEARCDCDVLLRCRDGEAGLADSAKCTIDVTIKNKKRRVKVIKFEYQIENGG